MTSEKATINIQAQSKNEVLSVYDNMSEFELNQFTDLENY